MTTSYPRTAGDPAGTFVAGHVDWLVRQGHNVDVVCAGEPGVVHRSWQQGVSLTQVNAMAGLFYAGGAPEAFESATRFGMRDRWRAIHVAAAAAQFSVSLTSCVARRMNAWDAVFAHWLVPSGVSSCLQHLWMNISARRARRPPIVVIAHSGDVHLVGRLGLTTAVARVLRAADASISFVSASLRNGFLARIHGRPLCRWTRRASIVTPMGVDVAHFANANRPRRPSDAWHVLFLGRLVPIKGVDILLAAIADAQRLRNTRIVLTIAGAGPSGPALKQFAAERLRDSRVQVVFTGEVRGSDRDALFTDADVLVLPSVPRANGRSEGTPVTALEAMAARVPVIASRTGGLADIPDDAISLVPPGDPSALAQALRVLEMDPIRRQRQIRAAIGYVETLDWNRVGPRLMRRVR